jgi:uroporphyrinogen-III synthase
MERLDEALAKLSTYDWLVFTSAAAARLALARLPVPWGSPVHSPVPRVAAVGVETASAIAGLGVPVSVTAADARQEGLLAALGRLRPGTRVLFPQAIGGRTDLQRSLSTQGCVVDVVPASETRPVADPGPLPAFDLATFASPSAVAAFCAAHGPRALVDRAVVVLGPTTAAAARTAGLAFTIAARPSIDAVIEAAAAASAAGTARPATPKEP